MVHFLGTHSVLGQTVCVAFSIATLLLFLRKQCSFCLNITSFARYLEVWFIGLITGQSTVHHHT